VARDVVGVGASVLLSLALAVLALIFKGWALWVLAGVSAAVGLYLLVAVQNGWWPSAEGESVPKDRKQQPRIKVKNSEGWTWEDTEVADDGRPLVHAKNSPRWSWKRTKLVRRDQ
jgi:hypothetical protein